MHRFSVFCISFSFFTALSALAEKPAMEEVFVVGELRRVEQLKLANSVSVIDAQLIEQRNAKNLEDILNLAPNVNFSTGASRGRFIQIRGIGERSQFEAPINPSVGVIVDGIDFTGLATGVATLDVAQMEVFRGPQGTLYGANALAGMINVVGKAPSESASGEFQAGAGNYGAYDVSASFSTGLSESLGWRLGAQKTVSDGYIENDYLDRSDTNNIDESALRNHFRFAPSADTRLDWITYFIDVDNGYDAFSLDNNRNTLSDEPGHDRQETLANALKLQYSGMRMADFQALVSHADSNTEYGYDEDWAYVDICPSESECAYWQYSTTDNYERDHRNLSTDFRLLSKADADTQWVIGLYYRDQQEDLHRSYKNNFPNEDFYNPDAVPSVSYYDSDYSTENAALYGQIEFALSEGWTLISGARGEQFSARFDDSDGADFAPEETMWGGKLALEYSASNNTLYYGLVSRGYKVGGFNPEPALELADRTFDNESMMNYELGLKGNWLENSLSMQMALFLQQRNDIQVKQSRAEIVDGTVDFIDFIDNAESGTNTGLELEFNWLASEQVRFFGTLGLLQAEFGDFLNYSHVDRVPVEDEEGDVIDVIPYDMEGRDQAHAPNYQYFFGAEWNLSLPLVLRVEAEGKDAFYFSESHNQQSEDYTLFNARAEYAIGAATLALWIRNISDELVETRGFYFSNAFGNDPRKLYAPEPYTQKGAPRTYGGSIQYTF